MTKKELVTFVKEQTNVELANEKVALNRRKKVLYTEIPKKYRNAVLTALRRKGLAYEHHLGDAFFIWKF